MSREHPTPRSEQRKAIAFHASVLVQIARWHKIGLIDARTRATLAQYERSQIGAMASPTVESPQPTTPTPPSPATKGNDDEPAIQRQATQDSPPSAVGCRPSAVGPEATEPRTEPEPQPKPQPEPKPSTSPRPPTVTPLPLPANPRSEPGSTLAVMGQVLRERTWWLVGAALTVVGSFFVAGTIWSDLGTGPRLAVVLLGLATYTQAFAAVGHRLAKREGGERAGRWLVGVSVAMAPVLAMAAGSGWSLGGLPGLAFGGAALLAVALLLALRLPRDLPLLLPSSSRPLRWVYTALSLGVALLPLAPSAFWLLLPAATAAVGLWWALTRWRRLPISAGLLLLHPIAFHAYLAPHGWSGAYAPTVAVAALAVLYLDAALGRWRGIQSLRLRGLRGVVALALAGLALLLLLPGFDFLPSGPESAITGMLLVPFFVGAALCWRRPVLVHGALLALLIFTLALPDLFWAMVEPFLLLAGAALGYSDEPLPIAWYSMTLLPYLLVCRLAAGGLRRSGWRQAERMSAHAWGWTFALSLLLLVVAHSRLDDLRPALLALPFHGLLWLREHRVRNLVSGSLPWIGLTVWTVDLLWFLDAGPELRLLVGAAVVLALIPAARWLAARLREPTVLTGARIVAVPAALAVPLLLAGWQAPALALAVIGATTWLVSLGLRPLGAPPEPALYRLESLLAVFSQTLLLAGGVVWAVELDLGPLGWAGGLEAVAIAALLLAWWLPKQRARVEISCTALEVWAHALALAAVVALLGLEGWERSVMKLPVAFMLVYWLRKTHWRVYGGLLVFGVAESILRRVWAADVLELGSIAVIAVALCWLPAAFLILSKRAVPRFGVHWLHRSLGQPAAWLGAIAALHALPFILAAGAPGLELQLAAIGLVALLWTASRLVEPRRAQLELSAMITAISCAGLWALGGPLQLLLPWLPLVVVAIGLSAMLRPSGERTAMVVVAASVALLVALVHGPIAEPQLIAAAAVALTLLALRQPTGWAEAAVVAWIGLAHTLIARDLSTVLSWHLVASSVFALLLLAGAHSARWLPRFAPAARRVGLVLAFAGAAAWSVDLIWVEIEGIGGLWCLGLVAATALLWAYRHGASARLLAPWAISACLLTVDAEPVLHPLAWLAFATIAWLPSPRRASDRVGTRLLAALVAVGLVVLAVLEPSQRPLIAAALTATGLLVTHTGSQHRWAWGGLAAGLICAAALSPLEPVAVLLRSSLAFTLIAGLRHLPKRTGQLPAQAALWLLGALALGACTGAWALAGLTLAAGALLLLRTARGHATRGPGLLEEPAGWILLIGSVAMRVVDEGGTAEWFLLAAAVPLLAWRQPRPWLFLASLPLLAWLPGELGGWDFTIAWPASLAALALLAWALRERIPAPREALLLCLGLGSLAALLTLSEHSAATYAAVALPLALGWWLAGFRAGALLQLVAGLGLASWDGFGLPSALPAAVLLLGVIGARKLGARWLEIGLAALLIPAVLVDGVGAIELDASAWQQAVLAAAVGLSLLRTATQQRPERWYATFGWGALLYAVLRLDGVLMHLPAKLELPLLVGLGLLLEGAAVALERSRGERWVQPLRHATLGAAAVGLAAAVFGGGLTSIGVALAGCLLCLRWVLRERSSELIVGVLLLDIATVMLFVRLQWTEPLAWIGPTGLSLLVIAQVLRQGMDPRIRDLLRYAGACCIYITALGQAVFDPGWTLGLVLLSIAGLALGSVLRVRAFLFLGTGFLASALLTELLRFGLTNSQFWAFYLTTIGLTILAGMVAITVLRPQLVVLRSRWQDRLRDWE